MLARSNLLPISPGRRGRTAAWLSPMWQGAMLAAGTAVYLPDGDWDHPDPHLARTAVPAARTATSQWDGDQVGTHQMGIRSMNDACLWWLGGHSSSRSAVTVSRGAPTDAVGSRSNGAGGQGWALTTGQQPPTDAAGGIGSGQQGSRTTCKRHWWCQQQGSKQQPPAGNTYITLIGGVFL